MTKPGANLEGFVLMLVPCRALLGLLFFCIIVNGAAQEVASSLIMRRFFIATEELHLRRNSSAISHVANSTMNGTHSNGTLGNETQYFSSSAAFDGGYISTSVIAMTPSGGDMPPATSAPPSSNLQTVVDPVLGEVVVRASQEFTLPNTTILSTEGLSYQITDPRFSQVGVYIPPGAWPPNERRNPTIRVFDPPDSLLQRLKEDSQTELAGQMVDFGPSGYVLIIHPGRLSVIVVETPMNFVSARIAFLKAVSIALPRDPTYSVNPGSSLLVHVYDGSTWSL